MRHRNYPQHGEDYGMRGDERRQYRGRESYEQQSKGGEGGRSGMWDHRFVPRDLDEPYRNNADEDRRGYQDIRGRTEFESASRPDYGRYDRSNYGRWDDDEDARYGFDMRDYSKRAFAGYDQGRIASGMYGRPEYRRRVNAGPKGYKRSDERIREDVCDRLGSDWDVDATDVEVMVSNGEVTLSGSVADRVQKFRIEHITDGVSGVNEVHNQLRVKREGVASQPSTTQSQATMQAGRSTANPNRSS